MSTVLEHLEEQLKRETSDTQQAESPKNPFASIRLSVVVTVYSETTSIAETIETLVGRDRGYIHEILLLVSPRSSEETFSICRECAARDSRIKIVVQKNNPGIGWAYREGMEAASGNYVALMAADLETEPAAVDRMVEKIVKTGCDGVIANRWLPEGGFTNYDPLKYVLNWIFQKSFKILFRTKIGDLTYGFKILSKEITRSIEWEGTLHEICVETTVKPIKRGYHIEEVASTWVARCEGASANTFFKNFRYVRSALHTLLATS